VSYNPLETEPGQKEDPMTAVAQFYDQLAADYHFIFADWKQSVQRQAGILSKLIERLKGAPPLTVLDCTCGIGTQAIGLALKGYTVHATDLSAEAVERARREAEGFGAELTFGVADLLKLDTQVDGQFDVVLAFDNALAHFLTDADLQTAIRNMAAKTVPGGLWLASLRDYDRLLQERPRSTQPQVADTPDGRRISFQVWDWSGDGHSYTLNHFTVKQTGEDWETSCRVTQLRAWRRAELTLTLNQVGLSDIQWHMPEASGYYQPVVTALKRGMRAT
jgi:ubiquinone/menaquinone biosynthesis C-methylase UbiE